MAYRRGKGSFLGLLYDYIRLFFDESYAPNKRRARGHTYRSRRFYDDGRDTINDTIRNEQLRDALYEQMAEDNARKERYEQVMREQKQSWVGVPKGDENDRYMDSL